jgi:mono/diheme cytochrome c family protein
MLRRYRVVGFCLLVTLQTVTGSSQEAAGGGAGDGAERGQQLYSELCKSCHGVEGRGDGPMAERLGFRPRDFTRMAFKCRSTPSGMPPTDADLARVINEGLSGTPMLGFARRLQPGDDRALVEYLKFLVPGLAEASATAVIEIPPVPSFTDEMIVEGRAVYTLLRCWTCHGLDGKGKGPAAGSLTNDWGDPIGVYDFTRRRRYKCGGEDEDLYRTLHTGLTGSPMPSFTEAFPFGADAVGDPSVLTGSIGPETVSLLRQWLAEQPTTTAIGAFTAEDRQALLERRSWSLIAFLRSLEAR